MVGLKFFTNRVISIIVIVSYISFFAGCGDDSCSLDTNTSDNKSDAGYYGKGVFFGGHELTGLWRVSSFPDHEFFQNAFFKLDGTLVEESDYEYRDYGYRRIVEKYGVNEDGNILTLIDDNTTNQYTFLESNSSCFTVLNKFSKKEIHFCKYDALELIDNTSGKYCVYNNTLGYFGRNVLLGYKIAIGEWNFTPINGGKGRTFALQKNGSGYERVPSIYSVVCAEDAQIVFSYGISQDGKKLTIKKSDEAVEIYQLINIFEGCYKMIHNNIEYKMCKS